MLRLATTITASLQVELSIIGLIGLLGLSNLATNWRFFGASLLIFTAVILLMFAVRGERSINSSYGAHETHVEALKQLTTAGHKNPSGPYEVALSVAIRRIVPKYNHLVFELVVKNPEVRMENVRVVYLIGDKGHKLLSASSLAVSNAMAEKPTAISPTGRLGIGVSRAFVLLPDTELTRAQLLEAIAPIRASVTWTTQAGRTVTDYYVFGAADLTIDKGVDDYFAD